MKSKKITDSDISDFKVSSLPTRPNAPAEFGGRGYTATELKEAFDKLPLYIIECFNNLMDDIYGTDGESIAGALKTGITSTHTLEDLFADIKSGEICSYLLNVDGTPLGEYLTKLRLDVNKIASKLSMSL